MLFRESARLSTKARWIVAFSVLGFLIAGMYFAGWTGAFGFARPSRGTEPAAPARTRPIVPTDESRVATNFGNLPLSFEPNQGQTDTQVKFLSRNPGYNLFLTSNEAVFTLPVRTSNEARPQGRWAKSRQPRLSTQAVLRMQIRGANPTPTVEGNTPLEGHTNYLVGRDSARWVRNIPQYGRVHYREIYPGVDLTFYGQQRQLEFDFIVKPGTDPAAIALGIEGASKIRTDEAGDLVLSSAAGDLRLYKPVAFQQQGETRQPVDARFQVKGKEVALAVGNYDRSRELVIDPSIAYSTYLGGGNEDDGFGIAVDSSGAYVTGQTLSSGFPNGTGSGFKGHQDAFVVKLKPDGTGLLYKTFVAGAVDGTGADAVTGGNAIAVAGGRAYVVGSSTATDLPTTANAAHASNGGKQDAFVAALNATGTALDYLSYWGGSDDEIGFGVALDSSGGIYAVGETKSTDFPLQSQLQGGSGGGSDGFVAKIKALPDGSVAYSSYLGGAGDDVATGVAVGGPANSLYVSGITFSTNFPIRSGAVQPTCGTCNGSVQHAFVTAIPATFIPDYVYSTYLHGSGTDEANLIAVDTLGNAYVVGQTASSDFPTTGSAFQKTLASGASSNAFVTKLNPTGSALVYSTYLGGGSTDVGSAIALDSANNAYVTGQTTSTNFPVMNEVQTQSAGGADAFVTELNAAGSALVFSTYLGGKNDENVTKIAGIAVDTVAAPNGPNIYVTGQTHSGDFPFTAGAYQTASAGTGDAFVTKISPQNLPSQFTISIGAITPSTISRGSTGTATITVTSTGLVGNVPLTCSVTPTTNAPTCSITGSPVNLSSGTASGTATLTITTTKPAMVPGSGAALWLPLAGLMLAGAGTLSIPGRKKMLSLVLGTLAFTGLLLMLACGSGSYGGGGGGGGGTPPGNYTVTVQGGVNGTNGTANFSVQ